MAALLALTAVLTAGVSAGESAIGADAYGPGMEPAGLSSDGRALSQGTAASASLCPSAAIYQQTAIPNDEVEQHVKFARTDDSIPSMFHGLFWMDQTGYYQTRPDRPDQAGNYETLPGQEDWFKSFPHNLKGAAAELLVGFGGAWNETTQCATISPRSDHWTYANATGMPGTGSINWLIAGSGLMQFCLDPLTGSVKLFQQPCAYGEDVPKAFYQDTGRRLIPKPWGFERLNLAWEMSKEYSMPKIAQRYAVYRIVDGEGKRTAHYQAYSDFMKTRCWFAPGVSPVTAPQSQNPECASKGGFLVNLGDGTQIIGKPLETRSALRGGR